MLLASEFFLDWAEAAHARLAPAAFSEWMARATPSVAANRNLTKVVVHWRQSSQGQVGCDLEIAFQKPAKVELCWGKIEHSLKSKDHFLLEDLDSDGASVDLRGKTLTVTTWHDHQTSKGCAVAERCGWFPLLGELVRQKPKITDLVVGWGEDFGPVRQILFDLDAGKEERFLKRAGYIVCWPDMRPATGEKLEDRIYWPKGVAYRKAPDEVASTGSLNWGYRGPKFRGVV